MHLICGEYIVLCVYDICTHIQRSVLPLKPSEIHLCSNLLTKDLESRSN